MQRASGVLLHLTCLPGPHGSGDLGPDAFRFVDWLVEAGQQLWQVLPLGSIGPGNSPYMSLSAFAGNPLLINLQALAEEGWLESADLRPDPAFSDGQVEFAQVVPWRMERLRRAAARFARRSSAAQRRALAEFRGRHADWLDDYTVFMAQIDLQPGTPWCDWPQSLAQREPEALAEARQRLAEAIAFWEFCQWQFFAQWGRLKAYANQRGVRIVGDTPIFIAYHSADVWARPGLFELDPAGRPTVIAGVPPDDFSATGQRWGNPLYRWSAHAAEGYAWWIERIRRTFELVDMVRIDHFIGFSRYWEIPVEEPTAERGSWKPGPGDAVFVAIHHALGDVPIIAEDLGVVTPQVVEMRERFGYPGMRILQQAFGDQGKEEFLPHAHQRNSVVYTGTHDNDTVLGWWQRASESEQRDALAYLDCSAATIHWEMVRAACASVARMAVYPLQDLIGLAGEARMNFPGEGTGWWKWRFAWQELPIDLASRLATLCALYRRTACPQAQLSASVADKPRSRTRTRGRGDERTRRTA